MRIENPNSRRHRIANPMQLRNPTQRMSDCKSDTAPRPQNIPEDGTSPRTEERVATANQTTHTKWLYTKKSYTIYNNFHKLKLFVYIFTQLLCI